MRRKIGLSLSELPRLKFQARTRARRGFSLIELLGVLAIMGVLAALTVPPIIRQLQQARTTNEEANLEEVARAIVEGIKATGTIPNPNIAPFDTVVPSRLGGWADVAFQHTTLTDDTAPGGGFAPGALHYVFPAQERYRDNDGVLRDYADTARRIYLDPQLLIYLESLYGGLVSRFIVPAGGWPLTTAGGVNFPNQALKMFIVSSSRPDFVLSCPVNGPGVQDSANNYGNPVGAPLIDQLASWIKAVNPATRFINDPGAAVENWTDDGHQYLHVKIVDLRPLFCRVNLREFPYPQSATTQIANSGAGYTAANTYTANIGAFSFSFLAPGPNFNDPATGLGTPASSIALGSTRTLLPRLAATTTSSSGSIPGGGIAAQFDVTINQPPWWGVNPPGVGAGNQMPNNANTETFYVIKGTSLSLYPSGPALTLPPILTVQINADSTFEYFNGSWTRVD